MTDRERLVKARKEAKRFKRKYLELKRAFDLVENDILDLANTDACKDYQLGINFGLLKAGEIIAKRLHEIEYRKGVWNEN